jgi:hypothetical protein
VGWAFAGVGSLVLLAIQGTEIIYFRRPNSVLPRHNFLRNGQVLKLNKLCFERLVNDFSTRDYLERIFPINKKAPFDDLKY